MTINLDKISSTVDSYLSLHPEEADTLSPLLEALAKGFDFTSRHRFPAHITAGIVLVDPADRVLQIHHRGLGRWLNPGGHCEPEDKTLTATALRELAEECAVAAVDVEHLGGEDALPIHIGVHLIPENGTQAEPAHRHFDFRFAFRTLGTVPVQISHEASAHRWLPLDELGEPAIVARLGRASV
jgi:8-oxo-dGTP pyrophosphatase MutT (NUDIX family)